MPSLEELHQKWFLDFDNLGSGFLPPKRHYGSSIRNYTSGNLVELLIDGQSYMSYWHDSMRATATQAGSKVYVAGCWLEDVRTLGYTDPTSNAIDIIKDVHNNNVGLYILLSQHLFSSSKDTVKELLNAGVGTVIFDGRFPPYGAQHQKFVCIKNPSDRKVLLGSIDINKVRWDRSEHSDIDAQRHPGVMPTHDCGVMVKGPAVGDLEMTFIQRWNEWTKIPSKMEVPALPYVIDYPDSIGSHSVQVLRTYGRTSPGWGYTWAKEGEFTVWAAYLNAIKKAERYIYIEDQYFMPFLYHEVGIECFETWHEPIRDHDLMYQLGEAIKRGVKVVVVVPGIGEDAVYIHQKYRRDIAVRHLMSVANHANKEGNLVVAHLHNGDSPYYVHSKLMVCDDEFVLLGSANFGQRSMTNDSELQIGVVDANNNFAQECRKQLWAEHTALTEEYLHDWQTAFEAFKEKVETGQGLGNRLRSYDSLSTHIPTGYQSILKIMEMYAGPERHAN